MSILIFIGIPICWAILGKVLGLALSAAFFYSDAGKRLGQRVSRWCVPIFPCVMLIALFAGIDGNAGRGVTLFGSDTLFDLACIIPIYAIPILLVPAALIYVVRDLTLGHTAKTQEVKS